MGARPFYYVLEEGKNIAMEPLWAVASKKGLSSFSIGSQRG